MATEPQNSKRAKKGIVIGLIGLALNFLLGASKLIAGILTGSVAILTDAVNNFSDSGASVVTSVSFALSSRKADKEHPYGHGRYEYVASFIIGLFIVFVGFQFVIESVKKIFAPSAVDVSVIGVVILVSSVAVKLFMLFFYRVSAKKLGSDSLYAASADSLSDCLITSVVLVAFIMCKIFPSLPFSIDGACGVLVSVFVIISGVKIVIKTIGKLLGNGGDLKLGEKVYELICAEPLIIGAHDLRLHDYGPGVRIGSVHAEFDKDLSITQAHDIIDRLEKEVMAQLGVDLVIHVDPINISDPVLNKLRAVITAVIKMYRNSSIHELAIDYEAKAISFHIQLPVKYEEISHQIKDVLSAEIAKTFGDYTLDIGIDLIN